MSTARRIAAGAVGLGLVLTGLTAAPAYAAPTQVQILATNDFHGRILNNTTNGEAGAAVLAGAVKQLRGNVPNTVFAAAGDLIGASTFESFIQHDKPTIDALNAAGLEVSAVGNHELDQGYNDLVNRVMAPYDATTNPFGGAQWKYIAANLKLKATGDDAVPATWIRDFGDVQVGFVGAVTEELPALVSPGGIADIDVEGIVSSVNTEAADLVTQGADVVVMLVHEGAPSTNCATMNQAGTVWGDIVNTVSPDVDAIVSGHTHLAYNCSFPVPEWAGRAVTSRPVVSAGQYGTNLNQLLFTVDSVSGDVSAVSQAILPLENPSNVALYPADPTVAQIAADAAAAADVLGAQPLGQIGGEFNRAKLANGTTENRGGESTLGNLVAEVQRWATEAPESGSAEIAFMNPGGLRADMIGTGTGSFPRTLTFKQAALVQPFANTLVNMQLTGAQIKTALEQQWQPRDSLNRLLTRPFLRLGVSEGFEYTYSERIVTEFPFDNPATPDVDESLTSYQGRYGTVTGMWLNGVPIDPAATYSVTVNSFLSTGGDNFFELNNGTGKRDTGKIDLTAMVDYMAAFAGTTPLPVDYEQHAVDVTFPAGAPATYLPTGTVTFDVKSWAMSTAADAKDATLAVSLGGTALGSFPVDNTIGTAIYDHYGTTTVSVQLPANAPVGATELTLTGATTGTSVTVPITIAKNVSTVTATAPSAIKQKKETAPISVAVASTGVQATGTVQAVVNGTVVDTAQLVGGAATLDVGPFNNKGVVEVEIRYLGDTVTDGDTSSVSISVVGSTKAPGKPALP
jgi:5'-nucleotidase